jgi:hypothetical protein
VAITSRGYTGTIDYADWATVATHMGGSYSVFGEQSFVLSAGEGDREVVIGPGTAAGAGIIDVSDSSVSLSGESVTSGSRWDMVVLHREWGVVNATSLQLVTGGSSKALPARETSPGTEDDQPLYLVRFTAGQTAVQEIVDLRVWRGDAGLVANDLMVRDYMNRPGTQVRVGTSEWWRVLVSGTPTWIDFATWDRLTGKPSTFPPDTHTHDRLTGASGATLRLGTDEQGDFVRASGNLVYGRTYTSIVPSAGARLMAVTSAGTLGALPTALPVSAGGTGGDTAASALRGLGIYADESTSRSFAPGQAIEFPFTVPDGSAASWVVIPACSESSFPVRVLRSGTTLTIRAANPSTEGKTAYVSFIAVRKV